MKDPAFLFYPNDYIGGTMGMTFEEKGAYMDLLMLQFNRGHMGGHMIGQVVGQIWVNIQDKFKIDADGLYYNQRLDDELMKRQNFVASRLNNIYGVNQHTKKPAEKAGHMGGHVTSHGENVNEDINIDVILTKEKGSRGKPFVKPTLEELCDYCNQRNNNIDAQAFLDHYDSNGWLVGGKAHMKDWKASVRTWEKNNKNQPVMNSKQNPEAKGVRWVEEYDK